MVSKRYALSLLITKHFLQAYSASNLALTLEVRYSCSPATLRSFLLRLHATFSVLKSDPSEHEAFSAS
ncbi:hypothetical protein M5X08_27650, partial [Paenibacillus apiarius]|uniref:hypothetical protein n=1 Tax=Paenibacillus apiarius TaxID=46240 RepID=UPI00228356C2